MDDKTFDSSAEGMNTQRPKPIRKLVKVNKNKLNPAVNRPESYTTPPYQQTPPIQQQPQQNVNPMPQKQEQYAGKHEAPQPEPRNYRGKHEKPPQQVYRGMHEAVPAEEYHGLHEAPPKEDEKVQYEPSPDIAMIPLRKATDFENGKFRKYRESNSSWKDILIKVMSIAASLVIMSAMILNMPILVDKKTGNNVSIVYTVKHWQPANKEGDLDKTNVQLNISTDITEDFNDGLDLPQLVEGQYSILFLGFDQEEFNSDVMWVVQFDIGNAKMNILQIPRDCCLPDYTSSITRKFNSVYSMGDPDLIPIQRIVNAVQENFGIPIDAYVTTACFDIQKMVDIIGGIPIHLDNEIIYEADKIIPAGDVVLNGAQAEWFIRFRHEWLQGDIGRMQNQRRFMAAAMKKLVSISKDEGKLKLYSYIKEIFDNDYIYTDLSVDDLSKVADFAATLSMENVRVNMVPGEDAKFPAEDGNVYDVYSVHKQATIDLLNAYYRPYQTPMTEDDTTIVELVTDYQYLGLDDTSQSMEELETATEPIRDPNKKPWWKED